MVGDTPVRKWLEGIQPTMPGAQVNAVIPSTKRKRKQEDDLEPPVKKVKKPKKIKRSKVERTQAAQSDQDEPSHSAKLPESRSELNEGAETSQVKSSKGQAKRKNGQPPGDVSQAKLDKLDRKRARKKEKREGRRARQNGTAPVLEHNDGGRLGDPTNDEEDPNNSKSTVEKGGKEPIKRSTASRGDASKQLSREHSKPGVLASTVAQSSPSEWTLSLPTAGRLLDHDPVFVQGDDGQDLLITSNEREVALLSLETSLVIRTHQAPVGLRVVCFGVDDPRSNILRIAYDDGSVSGWDWTRDYDVVMAFASTEPMKAMALSSVTEEKESNMFYIGSLGNDSAIYGSSLVLHVTKQHLHSIQVVGNADYLIAQGPSILLLGVPKEENQNSWSDFVWVEIPLMTKSTCFDARLVPHASNLKKKKEQPGLKLAIGNQDGQIHLYEDISTITRKQGKQSLPPPQVLHWHREAVSSVKFSRDGNYLISGGKETVLVLWQLQTGKKQFLPHLASEIERIVVNPKGDRYAIQTGDNAVMVLNTSELKPVANFAGLQMLCGKGSIIDTSSAVPAATLHPKLPNQLVLTVPSSQPKSLNDIPVRPFVQTFDVRTSRHITHQALTRNNRTDFNLGPERTAIVPPDVKQLAISHDGSWLATVDEWMPPASDLDHIASDEPDLESARRKRREVHLKFWRSDEEHVGWILTTRVDLPHKSTGDIPCAGRILALVSDPSSTGFATVGEDSCVKMWRPKSRKRHGVVLKTQADVERVEWTCKRIVHLVSEQERADSPMDVLATGGPTKACLSYSIDGSMLAVAQSGLGLAEAPLVHFINTSTSETISKAGLAAQEIITIGFLDRYFIAVSRIAVYVWDLVNDVLVYKIRLSSSRASERQKEPMLAINDADGSFGIVKGDVERDGSNVEVYGAREPRCLYEHHFETRIETILAGRESKGYTLLFADATIRTLFPPAAVHGRFLQNGETPITLPATLSAQVDVIHEDDAEVEVEDVSEAANFARDVLVDEDDRPVVRPEQLANVFDTAQSFAMPPVKDMFQAVAGMFGRRPFTKPKPEVLG